LSIYRLFANVSMNKKRPVWQAENSFSSGRLYL
jgi:hypothetical protein